jgi:hypothetical protein
MTRVQAAKLERLGLVIALSLSFAYGILLLLVRCRESFVRSRSEAMYAEFLKLRLGETTKADIEVLRGRFTSSPTENVDCGVAECEYTIGNVWGYSRWFLLTRIAHDHMPSSQLTLKTNGNLLSSASFYVGVVVPKGYGTREERKLSLSVPGYVPYSTGAYQLFGRASLVSALPEPSRDTPLTEKPDYRVWGPSGCMNCVAIYVSALPDLPKEKRAQVFEVNFNCMTQWSICTDKDDIMPTAGQEWVKESASAD